MMPSHAIHSQAFKERKAGKCTRTSENTAHPDVWCTMHATKQTRTVYEGIDHKSSDIFRLVNQMRKENVYVVGDKPVKNDPGEMSSEKANQNTWDEYYERLLNVEFDWDPIKSCCLP